MAVVICSTAIVAGKTPQARYNAFLPFIAEIMATYFVKSTTDAVRSTNRGKYSLICKNCK